MKRIVESELFGKKRPRLYGNDYNLRRRASEAFIDMSADARKEGIEICSVSDYRDFDHQKRIWNKKFQKYTNLGLGHQQIVKKIIEYSAMPGTSRHHWGTDMDVIDASKPKPIDVLQPEHFEEGGAFGDLRRWLKENSHNYDFFEVYTNNPGRKGFKYEPWHISFAELSVPMLKQYLNTPMEKYVIDETMKGSKKFSKEFLSWYKDAYVLGINPQLIP